MSSDAVPRGPTTAQITFYKPPADGSPPHNYVEAPPPGQKKYNFGDDVRAVSLSDIRGHESQFTLEKDAFQAIQDVSSSSNTSVTYDTFSSDDSIRTDYYPEVEQLLLTTIAGAYKVIIFDHTIRRQDPSAHRQPVHRAHVDQTAEAARNRVLQHITDRDEAERILREGTRYRIINVWRPLPGTGPVESNPLAFASAASVNEETDLVSIEHRYPTWKGETLGVKFNERQRWYYWSGMNGDEGERLLLQCADSKTGMRVPHSAFWDPRTREGARPRESIEVRALVLG